MGKEKGTGKFLVTGCAGFIGCFTAKKLLEQNFEVIGIDDLNDYYDIKLKKFRLDILKSFRKFTFLKLDISKKDEVFSLKGEKLDCIFNLGARAGVRASIKNPQIYVDANITGTLNLLSLCVENSIEKFVLASTSSIYAGVKAPFRESAKADSPLSPYAATKKAAELLAYTFHKLYKIDITIPRYFTVYGPAGRPDMSIFRFIKNIMEDKPIIIYGDGKQKRDFTYIDDIVEGTIKGTKKLGI
jgi:Nucleoside-diphosphate-sugar epimerases